MMEKEVSYSIRLDRDLKKAFNDTCKKADVPGSQLIREWMRQFVRENAQRNLNLKGK